MTTVGDLMSTELVSIDAHDTLAAAAGVMSARRVGSVLILDQDRLAGILTERDIVRAVSQDSSAPQDQVAHWMTRSPACVEPGMSWEAALARMQGGHFRHLPVISDGKLVGMLSMRDLVRMGVPEAR